MAREVEQKTRDAVAEAVEAAASTPLLPASGEAAGETKRSGARGGDPLTGELRRELLPLLVLHFIASEDSYGNQLIDRVAELTEGVLNVNPNTMYPLLRKLEADGAIEGHWEHPERRSRRFYSVTESGEAELARLRSTAAPALDALARSVGRIRAELFGS